MFWDVLELNYVFGSRFVFGGLVVVVLFLEDTLFLRVWSLRVWSGGRFYSAGRRVGVCLSVE